MTAPRISLDGLWAFVHRADVHAAPSEPRTIAVPAPWQAQFADLRNKVGLGLYRRSVDLGHERFDGRRIYLHFGAVFHNATVWVNGLRVGAHEGGFLNFSFDVTPHLRAGVNEVAVLAETPSDDAVLYPETPFAEIPFGKQSWYGPLSGIWQPVYLEWRPSDHIEHLRVRSAALDGAVKAEIVFRSPLTRPARLEVEILDRRGATVARTALPAAEGQALVQSDLKAEDVSPWSPDDPCLYEIRAVLQPEGGIGDQKVEQFGFRTIETRDGAFYLNGRHLHLRAALDQDYYPELICSVPSLAFIEDQFRKAKALGLNCLRLHIKVPDPRYYEAADRLGLLVWTELPNGGLSTERSRRRKERLLKGIVDRDGNHPSIVIWTIINENWGVDLVHDADHRAWLARTFAWLKAYDPTRLAVDNSPLAPSFHVRTDIADYHFYAAIPDHRGAWDDFVTRLARSRAWLFSPEGDAVVTGDEPRLCSEFGNWGLPDPALLLDAEGREPWWFESGHDWGDGVMYPHGIWQRFEDWSLDRVFGSLEAFVEAAQWQQFRALKYQIEAMRRRPELAGYVITEFTDVHWESNGLLDMGRNPRVFHDVFRTINADTVIVPGLNRFAVWEDEPLNLGLALAHGGPEPIDGGSLTIADDEDRIVPVPRIAPGQVLRLAPVHVRPRAQANGTLRKIALQLKDAGGAELARNSATVAVHPRVDPETRAATVVWSSDPDIRAHCQGLGYALGFGPDDTAAVIATAPSDRLADYVRSGGKLLLLPARPCPLQPFFPHWQNVRVQERDGTLWQGDWASSFSWLRRSGPFAALPGGPLLDETFDRVLPERVITGCNLLDFQARVHAGMVVGWVHRPAALAVERSYGRGRLLASTFRLFRDAPDVDPTASLLLDALIATTVQRRASGPPEQPRRSGDVGQRGIGVGEAR